MKRRLLILATTLAALTSVAVAQAAGPTDEVSQNMPPASTAKPQ